MNPGITVTVTGNNPAEIAKGLRVWAAALEGGNATPTVTKATKTKVASEPEDVDDGLEAATETEYTKEDILAGFKAYAAENGKEKALAILKKYKVKSAHDLDESRYPAVMESLGQA